MVSDRIIRSWVAISVLICGGFTPSHSREGGNPDKPIIALPLSPSLSDFGRLSHSPTKVFAASTLTGGTTADKEKRIRQSKAFWQSLLIPGLGQLAMNRKSAGYAFLTAEIALVGSLVGLRTYASRLEDDYRLYAHQHAGVSTGHEHMYYVDIGNWMNERLYNDERLRDRDFEALYSNPEDAWTWDSDANRQSFKTMRLNSDQARNTAVLVVGGMLINHLFSAIDAARSSGNQPSLSFSPNLRGGGTVTLSLVR